MGQKNSEGEGLLQVEDLSAGVEVRIFRKRGSEVFHGVNQQRTPLWGYGRVELFNGKELIKGFLPSFSLEGRDTAFSPVFGKEVSLTNLTMFFGTIVMDINDYQTLEERFSGGLTKITCWNGADDWRMECHGFLCGCSTDPDYTLSDTRKISLKISCLLVSEGLFLDKLCGILGIQKNSLTIENDTLS